MPESKYSICGWATVKIVAPILGGICSQSIWDTPDTSFVYAFPSTAEILISFSSSQRSNASLSCTVK